MQRAGASGVTAGCRGTGVDGGRGSTDAGVGDVDAGKGLRRSGKPGRGRRREREHWHRLGGKCPGAVRKDVVQTQAGAGDEEEGEQTPPLMFGAMGWLWWRERKQNSHCLRRGRGLGHE
jgi:hypothetical protein